MRIDSIVCNNPETMDLAGFDIDCVEVEWYEVSKKILHKISRKGIDVGIKLNIDRPLKHGDILSIEGNTALLVEIPECECIALKPETTVMMGKACYEIGNRHSPLFYQEERLLIPYDSPLLAALQKCGFEAYKCSARLISPLGGQSSGHSHSHSHDHANYHMHGASQDHAYYHSHGTLHDHSHEDIHEHGHSDVKPMRLNTHRVLHMRTDSEKNRSELRSYLSLLHISDPLLPIGGFTHSYGLETYVQKELVNSSPAAKNYLLAYLWHNYLYNDLLAMRFAWEYSESGNIEGVVELNNVLCASKAPKELRTASTKLGLRLIKILEKELAGEQFFQAFLKELKAERCDSSYCVVYGMAAYLLGIGKEEAMCAITYGTASAIINNCAKLIPISQMDGQKILFEVQAELEEIINKANTLTLDELGMSSIGFDIRSMQHERLYTRIYIS
ncbi:MAG: Urease accessory protein UreF [Eubacterium sp.]|nr:Urease accessory protein UreF [Eubacterium sp.]